jgi:hypothetical protein
MGDIPMGVAIGIAIGAGIGATYEKNRDGD